MSLVRMQVNIRPLCDEHPSCSMAFVYLLLQVGKDKRSSPAFACSQQGCSRHYNIIHGYLAVSDSRVERNTKSCQPCPIDGLPNVS